MTPEDSLQSLLTKYQSELPLFSDGRIDYTNATTAPAVLCFLEHDGEILLLKRSEKVLAYKGKWHGVGGFLDEPGKTLREKVLEELHEELGLPDDCVEKIEFRGTQKIHDTAIDRTWILYLVLVQLNYKPSLHLDWEHTDYRWIHPEDIYQFDTVDRLTESLQQVFQSPTSGSAVIAKKF